MKTIESIFISSLLLFMYSCNEESITLTSENNRVIGYLDNVSRTTFISNENITETHWAENDSIGLFSSTQQNLLYKALNSGKSTEFKAGGTKLNFDENNKVVAYYPYTDSINGNNIKLPNTTKINSSDSDISFMICNATVSNKKLNLYFNHLYAYLQIKLSTKDFSDKFVSMTEGTYKTEGVYLDIKSTEYISTSNGWFNTDTNKISYEENGASKRLRYICDNIDFNTIDTLTYMIPILPQAEETNVSVSIVFPAIVEGYEDGVYVYMHTLLSKKTPIGGFKAGHVYTINTVDDIKASPEQFESLKDLYDSTNGPLWKDNKNWLSDKPLKEWHGLNDYLHEINTTYVNSIKLHRNILTGTLPESFAKLMDKAIYIDLGENGMSGDIPEIIKRHKRWDEFGWNIVTQDTRLSNGFNLDNSNLYIPFSKILNFSDSCEIDIKEIISKNKLTQVICHYSKDANDMKDLFIESQVNSHLDYNDKGLSTILLIQTDNNIKEFAENINKLYKKTNNLYWAKSITSTSRPIYMGMSYLYDSNGQLVYYAPYHYEPYVYHEYIKENDVVHQKFTSFLKSKLGEPNEHNDFKFE